MSKSFVLLLLSALVGASSFGQEPVFINEFMANNNTGIIDENGDRDDWIELRNTSAVPVNLDGYYLTDTASNLRKWRLPSTNIAANGYLLIYASGKNRTTPRLHTNFSLDADGEYLAFVKPDGVTKISEFTPKFPQQYKDYSYGLDSTGTNWVYFSQGSPGAANTSGVVAFVKDTKFSQDRGLYDTPFDLAIITETIGATIRYTTNGTVPTLSNGFTYTNGVGIHINGTTVIRASAFKTSFQPSPPDTHTYIFLNDVIHQAANGAAPPGWPTSWGGNVVDYGMDTNVVNDPVYKDTIVNDLKTLPVFSIVMDLNDLFNSTTGIYANPGNDGAAWERPCSMEYIRNDGVDGFQINAGIRIRGGYSRNTSNPKHAFRFFFREEYGAGKLKYPLFGDNGAEEFDKIDIRTFQNYSWSFGGDPNGIFFRDVFSRDTQLAMGQQGERGDYCFLYINGMFWGIYNTAERPEAAFGSTYWGGDRENYDVIKVEAGPYTINATDGDMNAWTQLYNLAVAGFASNDAYFKVQGRNPDGSRNPSLPNYVDIDNLIDYMLVIFYGGNKDAPISNFLSDQKPNNWYGLRDRTGDAGFRFIAHDSEHTLLPGDIAIDRTGPFVAGQNGLVYSNPQYIFQQLAANPEFKLKIADHIHKHYFNNGLLTPAQSTARARFRMAQLDRAVVGESARWGDSKREPPLKRTDWLNACNAVLNTWIPRRSDTNMIQYRNKGWYPNVVAPSFSQHGGNVPAGYQLTMTAPAGTIYYTLDGSDPRVIGGAVSPTARIYSGAITLTISLKVKSRVLNSANVWSALNEADFYVIRNFTNLMITEIMYHPITADGVDATELEFIELKNTSNAEMDLSGIRFTNGISYAFPLGKKLSPGKFVVLVRDAAAFAIRYPGVAFDGVYTNKLADSGETISLVHAAGAPIFSVSYSDLAPWPISADGAGFSLVPRDSNLNPDPNNPANWRASTKTGGSPGQDDPPLNVLPIVVNEALTHTDLPAVDAIELYNPNNTAVDVGNWYLTDDRLTPKKFRIPAPNVINPNSYLVFTEADFNPTPGQGTSFSLSSHGDEVFLYSGDSVGNLSGYSDGFAFDGAQNGVTFGRYTNSVGEILFPAQLQNTLGDVNSGPRVGPVVINEIRYEPKPGDEEFVELRNLTSGAIKLYDVDHPTNHWKISGIDFTFPDGAEIPANGFLVVASVDPTLFRAHNSIPTGVQVYGPYDGALQDNGEMLELKRPDAPDQNPDGSFTTPYIVVDAVRYNDKAPWPVAAAGQGPSLERINS
ncbi:MAG TPA: lamin tail domain-containing protein, partial [Verrucomicrobiae bacterium]